MISDFTEGLNNLAQAAGMDVSEEGAQIPTVPLRAVLMDTAIALGMQCATKDIYHFRGEIIGFDEFGEVKTMTPNWFRTWISQHVVIVKQRSKMVDGEQVVTDVPTTLTRDAADGILLDVYFRRAVRKITAINRVRLPIRRESGDVELLPAGYDKESGVYTRPDGLEYDYELPLEAAKGFFNRYFGSFPFSDQRSKGVMVGAMLSLFIKHILPSHSLRPGFLFYANKPGSGKSVLAKACLYPTLGKAAAAKMKKGEEFDKEIEAFSINNVPYIFLDNVYGSIESASLDQLLTSTDSIGRAMGGQGIFEAENNAQIMITGNNLDINEDAQRRFLIVDLFEKGDPRQRVIDNPIGDQIMRSDVWREKALSACWSFVREWVVQDQPLGVNRLNSFETFSEILGGIVSACGYSDPMVRAEMLDEINPEKAEFLRLLNLVADEMQESVEDWTTERFARVAREHKLLEEKVGTEQDGIQIRVKRDKIPTAEIATVADLGYLDHRQGAKLGMFLAKQMGSVFPLSNCTLEFGKRSQRRKKSYTLIKTV